MLDKCPDVDFYISPNSEHYECITLWIFPRLGRAWIFKTQDLNVNIHKVPIGIPDCLSTDMKQEVKEKYKAHWNG